jgi:hypothetical protein
MSIDIPSGLASNLMEHSVMMPYVSNMTLYAKTAEEYCGHLLDIAEEQLLKGDIPDARRHLKIEIYFAKTSLGDEHALTKTGIQAEQALSDSHSSEVALFIIDVCRRAKAPQSESHLTNSAAKPAILFSL